MHSCPFLAAQSPEKRDIGLLVNMLSVQYMKDLCKGPTQPPALNPVPLPKPLQVCNIFHNNRLRPTMPAAPAEATDSLTWPANLSLFWLKRNPKPWPAHVANKIIEIPPKLEKALQGGLPLPLTHTNWHAIARTTLAWLFLELPEM